MDERSDGGEKMEEIMLPGFRFHPTDEELVGFYLKRKIQQRPPTIELIKQLDIYKYDPWDLPKLATAGEKEWYFYCPRDRKYRNSTRPNRVTGAGFWKATGTDRPIYSEGGSKCIGLKKSLVFYKGRAAKGAKTDWMMHEFRLPALSDPKRFLDKPIPANDLWAVCRIFKKTNTTAQRALSQSWVSPLPQTTVSTSTTHHFGCDQNMSSSLATIPYVSPILLDPYTNKSNIIPLMASPYHQHLPNSTVSNGLDLSSFMFPSSAPPTCSSTFDVSSVLLNMSSSVLGDFGKQDESTYQFGGSSYSSSQDHHCNNINGLISLNEMQVSSQGNDGSSSEEINAHGSMTMTMRRNDGDEQQWMGFPMSNLPLVSPHHEAWKSSLVWDSYPSTKC